MMRYLKALRKARQDQKKARYPGCREGLVRCLDLRCWCNERRPSLAFLLARTKRHLKGDIPEENHQPVGSMRPPFD